MKRFLFLITGIGAALLILAGYSYTRELEFLGRAETTKGIVTDYEVRGSGDKETYCPIFLFTRPDGQTVLYYGNICASPAAYEIGQQVDVLYDPLDIEWVQLDNFMSKYKDILMLLGIGLPLFLIGLVGLAPRKAKSKVG